MPGAEVGLDELPLNPADYCRQVEGGRRVQHEERRCTGRGGCAPPWDYERAQSAIVSGFGGRRP
jgi:hypothetical protein